MDFKEEQNKRQLKNKKHSLSWEIIRDLKKENKTIKVLLGLSILSNIIIVLMLK